MKRTPLSSRNSAECNCTVPAPECLAPQLGEQHLRQIVAEYVEHYHLERNHQGLGNALIEAPPANSNGGRTIRCRERLGGTLRYYHRYAA